MNQEGKGAALPKAEKSSDCGRKQQQQQQFESGGGNEGMQVKMVAGGDEGTRERKGFEREVACKNGESEGAALSEKGK